jgi:hypothetical protein
MPRTCPTLVSLLAFFAIAHSFALAADDIKFEPLPSFDQPAPLADVSLQPPPLLDQPSLPPAVTRLPPLTLSGLPDKAPIKGELVAEGRIALVGATV